jgi:hypothetical protein
MRTRFTWLLVGLLVLIAFGLLMACGRKYSSVANGLVVVTTQAQPVMETFSLNLNTGGISQINNVNGPPTPGLPSTVILDPAGAFAYVLVTQNSQVPGSATGVAVFPVLSDGKLGSESAPTTFAQTSATVSVPCGSGTIQIPVSSPVNPVTMIMDSSGKYLFIADSVINTTATYTCNSASVTQPVQVPGTVSVLAVSSGKLTEVPGSPFAIPLGSMGPVNVSALAVSHTVFPPAPAICSQTAPPTSENLYVTDEENSLGWEFGVSASGALGPPPGDNSVLSFPTGTDPDGITVDPCNRFAYVSNSEDNTVSAYTVCTTANSGGTCPVSDGRLVTVASSPFADQGITPGPLSEDTYGNFLYVVNASNSLSAYTISQVTGKLTAMNPPTLGTGTDPVSIAIRSDDIWIFVANFGSANVSQFAITPQTGKLTPQQPFDTVANYPYGVAVK